uniref:Uncharacterized protein n=1 Tax=Trichuris muris TaxID=70415 RepID=A0A5S6QKZ3_TRIMR
MRRVCSGIWRFKNGEKEINCQRGRPSCKKMRKANLSKRGRPAGLLRSKSTLGGILTASDYLRESFLGVHRLRQHFFERLPYHVVSLNETAVDCEAHFCTLSTFIHSDDKHNLPGDYLILAQCPDAPMLIQHDKKVCGEQSLGVDEGKFPSANTEDVTRRASPAYAPGQRQEAAHPLPSQ